MSIQTAHRSQALLLLSIPLLIVACDKPNKPPINNTVTSAPTGINSKPTEFSITPPTQASTSVAKNSQLSTLERIKQAMHNIYADPLINTETPPPALSEAAKPFVGDYAGVLPCGDCEGIALEVNLQPSGQVIFTQQYLGTAVKATSVQAPWHYDPKTHVIRYTINSQTYFMDKPSVHELRMLDMQGLIIKHSTAKQYILKQRLVSPS